MSTPGSFRRVTIVGYYGFGNTGDEVILAAMLKGLRRRPGLSITVASATPSETAATHNVHSILWSDTEALMTSVEAADLVIVGGGGLFHDSFGFNPDAFLTDQQTGIAYYTSPVFLAAMSRKPVMLYALGAGPLLSETGRLFTKTACDLASSITVRDEGSRDVLRSVGVEADRILVTADPAFTFALDKPKFHAAPRTNPKIAVSVRHWDRDIAPAFWERELARALDLAIDRRDAEVLFVPFQRLKGQPEDDEAVAVRIRGLMRRSDRASVSVWMPGPDAVIQAFRGCDAVLGMRLHSAILGLCAGLPVVALSYEPKVAQAMDRAGIGHRAIDLRALDATRLVDLLEEALDSESGKVDSKVREIAAEAIRNSTIALDLLGQDLPALQPFSKATELLPRIVRARIEEAASMRLRYNSCVADVATLMARVRDLEGELAHQREAHEKLERESGDREKEWVALAENRASLALRVSEQDREIDRLRAEAIAARTDEAQTQRALSERAEELQKELLTLVELREGLARQVSEQDREIDRLRAVNQTERAEAAEAKFVLSQRAEELQRELLALGELREGLAQRVSEQDREIDQLRRENRTERAEAIAARTEAARTQRLLSQQAEELRTELLALGELGHNLTERISAQNDELTQLRADRDRQRAEAAETNRLVAALREESASLRWAQSAGEERAAAAAARWADEKESLEAAHARTVHELNERLEASHLQFKALNQDAIAMRDRQKALLIELETATHAKAALQEQISRVLQAIDRQYEETRQAVLAAANRFQEAFRDQLIEYRNQRAWQLMLLARKAYTLLYREGWQGRAGLIPLAWRTLIHAPLELAPFDLTFPRMPDYLPEQVFLPRKPIAEEQSIREKQSSQEKTVETEARGPWTVPRYDVVVFPVFDFEFRFQRPQQIAAQLARRGHRVFWVSPSRRLEPEASEPFKLVELRPDLYEVQLRRQPFDLYRDSLDEAALKMPVESLECLYREQGIAENAILLQFPFWRQFGRALAGKFEGCLIYDQMDDWQNWPSEPRISAFNIDQERLLVNECDVLVVTSARFAERSSGRVPPPCLIPNAADFEFFSAVPARPRTASRPVVGYYGAIAAWFDLDLAVKIATARPQYDFVFVGGVHGRDATPLSRLPNTILPGEKNYRELPALLQSFDVCLIPFVLSSLTHTVDPVKVYEYLSQGKPVVATAMAELEPLSDLIYVARDSEDFLRLLDKAVHEGAGNDQEARQSKRIAFARRNTWAARAETLCEAADAAFPLISIVVLTHNSREFVRIFCESIVRNTAWPRYELIFVDNASTDGTVTILHKLAGTDSRIRVIELRENAGFAAGNNAGVAAATGQFLVILNPDTILSHGWLHILARHLRKDPGLGMIAPVTNHSGNETRIDFSYRDSEELKQFARERARLHFGRQRDLTMAPLMCVMLRASLWKEIGPLDERFKVGMFEDDDYSRRVRQAGYRIATAEDCFVHHFGSGSFSQLPPDDSLRIFAENRSLYEAKWGISWQEHRSRENVRPLRSAQRFSPADFCTARDSTHAGPDRGPSISALAPSATIARQAMNRQPDGSAALVVHCSGATPDTVVRWNENILPTTFAGTELLTALVPAELYAEPATAQVTLLNEFGVSEPMLFRVE